jgi:geranylgeranyl diphosphate synthase, type I
MGTMSSVVGCEMDRARTLGDQGDFERFVAEVRSQVDARLATWLDARVTEAAARGANVGAVAEAVRQLVLRGGKRMRAVLLAATYLGCHGIGGLEAVVPAGAALELLQAYLLVHDDWMDGDDMRRGGPSVPAMMRAHFGTRDSTFRGQPLGDAASVLAGDLAASWALRSILEVPLAPARVTQAVRELARVEDEVVQGQLLDVCADARDASDVEAVYALKTASYTARGPVIIGARLAGADDAQLAALTAFAEPLGIAFQLRDDVISTLGDTGSTGKPRDSDLRRGRRTALVVEAMRDPEVRDRLLRVLGHAEASDGDIGAAVASLRASGAHARVEKRIGALVGQANEALDRARLTPDGRALLACAVVALTERDR